MAIFFSKIKQNKTNDTSQDFPKTSLHDSWLPRLPIYHFTMIHDQLKYSFSWIISSSPSRGAAFIINRIHLQSSSRSLSPLISYRINLYKILTNSNYETCSCSIWLDFILWRCNSIVLERTLSLTWSHREFKNKIN